MRDSFIFYSSFAQAAQTLGDKARLKLYDAVIKLGLCCAENVTELERVCNEIETSLAQNRNAFAQFLLIKPQIIANFTRYLNGKKGKDFGMLGGAPKGNKNASKNNPKTTPNVNVNVNVNENDNINNSFSSFSENQPQKTDEHSSDFEEFWKEYPKQRAGNKQKAFASYKRVLKERRATVEELLEAVKRYSASDEVKRGFAKGCQAWLNDDRFNSAYVENVVCIEALEEQKNQEWKKWLSEQTVEM